MPFYEYLCTECGRHTELLQRMSDPPATECPSCHAQALVKQVSAAGFRLKGGGWYETDFKSSGQRNLVGEGGGETAKADGGEKKAHGCAAGACGCAAPAPTTTTTAAATPAATPVTPAPTTH